MPAFGGYAHGCQTANSAQMMTLAVWLTRSGAVRNDAHVASCAVTFRLVSFRPIVNTVKTAWLAQ